MISSFIFDSHAGPPTLAEQSIRVRTSSSAARLRTSDPAAFSKKILRLPFPSVSARGNSFLIVGRSLLGMSGSGRTKGSPLWTSVAHSNDLCRLLTEIVSLDRDLSVCHILWRSMCRFDLSQEWKTSGSYYARTPSDSLVWQMSAKAVVTFESVRSPTASPEHPFIDKFHKMIELLDISQSVKSELRKRS